LNGFYTIGSVFGRNPDGNMYLEQTDYGLPGFGEGLRITRTYNSKKQSAGLFGYGWSSILDESITTTEPRFRG
jgi:hypothetical protein